MKVAAFCEWEGTTPPAFAHWWEELPARDARPAEAAEPMFAPVDVTRPAAAMPLEVALGNGRSVRVPPGFDLAHRRAVLAVLQGPPC